MKKRWLPDFWLLKLMSCRKGNSFQGQRVGSCLTLGNELFEETHVLTKKRLYQKEVPRWRAAA